MTLAACAGTTETTDLSVSGPVRVVRVLDGDSLVVDLDGTEAEVRLLGVNTPERDECYHADARDHTIELAGDRVRLAGTDRDRYGRLLRYAYAVDDSLINQRLIEDGAAIALSTEHPLLMQFKIAERIAFDARLGRWRSDACGPASSALIGIAALEPDAPGDDARNAKGEWVELENRSQEPADLTGWILRDESSSHRFEFPIGTVLAAGDRLRVYSGCGVPGPGSLYWCDGDPVWNNQGDTAYLLDDSGNAIDRFAF